MQQAPIAKGVPEAAICDYADFHAGPVVRARKVFGESRITIISRKHSSIINGRSGWRNNMALTLSALTRPDLNKRHRNQHTTSRNAGGLARCWMPKFCTVSLNIWALASLLGLISIRVPFASKMPECVAAHWQGRKAYIDEKSFWSPLDVFMIRFCCNWD